MNKHNRFVGFSNLVINHGLQPRRGNNNYRYFNYINNLGNNLKSYFNPKDNLLKAWAHRKDEGKCQFCDWLLKKWQHFFGGYVQAHLARYDKNREFDLTFCPWCDFEISPWRQPKPWRRYHPTSYQVLQFINVANTAN